MNEDKLGTLEEAIEFDKKRNYQYTVLSNDEIDTCAYETGMWCDGTPDAWDTEAIHNFARAILKKASEK